MEVAYLGEFLEKKVFEEAYERIKREKRIADVEAKELFQVFSDRFRNALTAIEEEKVRKYVFSPSGRAVWAVAGKDREYQILPIANFCSCNDFYFRVLSRETFLCYHLIAQKLAEALEKYLLIMREDEQYEALMSVLRESAAEDRKLPVEEAENVRGIVKTILSEGGGLSAKQLVLEVQAFGFEVQTPQHLAAILVTDKKKRFKCEEGKWFSRRQDKGI